MSMVPGTDDLRRCPLPVLRPQIWLNARSLKSSDAARLSVRLMHFGLQISVCDIRFLTSDSASYCSEDCSVEFGDEVSRDRSWSCRKLTFREMDKRLGSVVDDPTVELVRLH
jgi:hypothetical protein